jgi:hypothetical protein
MLLFDCRPLRELFEKSLVAQHPTVGSIPKYLRRNLFQESGVGAYELAVFLVTGNLFPNQRQRFPFELPKITIFLNFGVVDKSLVSYPLR